MRTSIKSLIRVFFVGFSLLFISGCKEVLYSDLGEREANEMVAVLAAVNIDTSRERTKKGAYSILVSADQVPVSVTVLKNAGYPKAQFLSLGDVFSTEGIVGTPFEQQARYLHAMNEELSNTITSIDGIRNARVLVTSPPRGRYDRELPKARASVTVHYEPELDIKEHVPSIKLIVAYAMPNLSYDDVAVASFLAGGPQVKATELPSMGPQTESQQMSILSALSWGGTDLGPIIKFLLPLIVLLTLTISLISRTSRSVSNVRAERKWMARAKRS
ncbi:type III secretion system inner membrane ring lipoprotein SctJ [Aestuariibius insulae]|uniref:type III secretion system inner membrane ring lipoprotein SctJ n=1 Tax=Aestuariibius insulae TaxID=2058287 RepID=UPI00345E852A